MKNKHLVRISSAVDNYDCIIKKKYGDGTNIIIYHIRNLEEICPKIVLTDKQEMLELLIFEYW